MIRLPALALAQGPGRTVYQTSLRAGVLRQLADIPRIRRTVNGLEGYQRARLDRHVRTIARYLHEDDVVFPHALVVALGAGAQFRPHADAPADSPGGERPCSVTGDLVVPRRMGALRVVDGQQRILALELAGVEDLPVPLVAFAARDGADEREQFVRLNAGRPLARGVLYELIPTLPATLPASYERMRLPSLLVDALNEHPESPFRGLIRRASIGAPPRQPPFVTDTALLRGLDERLRHPRSVLFERIQAGSATAVAPHLEVLLPYWRAVRQVFADAWGMPPQESRLLHSVGLRALSRLLDPVMRGRDLRSPVLDEDLVAALSPLRASCAWTCGRWPDLGVVWNGLQATESHVSMLTAHLVEAYRASQP